MKNLIIVLVLSIFTLSAYSQADKNPYGPLPYRTIQQTISEDYYVYSFQPPSKDYDYLKKIVNGNAISISTDMGGKLLKLISIDGELGHFKDAEGIEYTNEINNNRFYQITPVAEIENAKKYLANKALWLNDKEINKTDKTGSLNVERFDRVIVIDVIPGLLSGLPVRIIVKTDKGEIGYEETSLSGTNTRLNPEYRFDKYFLTEDPKLTYHFTSAVWKMVKAGYTEIGMPIDAFRLVMGFPKDIHTTQTAKGTTVQWVYGTDHQSYYYFTNGKLTAKQD